MKTSLPDSGKIINLVTLLGMLILIFVIYKILAATGLIKTKAARIEDAKKAAAVSDLRVGDYFKPDYYRQLNYLSITPQLAADFAKKLRSAMGGVGTDEDEIFLIFSNLPSKSAISQISEAYQAQYGFPFYILSGNLQEDLLSELKPAEVVQLMTIISTLN